MLEGVIGLGSNLGDRRAYLGRAAELIVGLGELVGASAIYETAPVGVPQPDFLNAALRLRTDRNPHELLDELLGIELRLGRVRRERWGPRIVDLDILWFSERVVKSERLVVPHTELRMRAFALRPLLDVAPDAVDPSDGTRYAGILASLDPATLREIPGTRGRWVPAPSASGPA